MKTGNFLVVSFGLLVLSVALCGCSEQATVSVTTTDAADLEQQSQDLMLAYSEHDVEKVLSFMADDVEVVAPDGTVNQGKEGMRSVLTGMFAAIPDFNMEPLLAFGSGNYSCGQWIASGTPIETPEAVIPATGKSFSVRGATICEWREGRVIRMSQFYDIFTMQQQLGILPPTPQE